MPTTEVKLSQKTYEQSNNIIKNKLQRIGTTQIEKKIPNKGLRNVALDKLRHTVCCVHKQYVIMHRHKYITFLDGLYQEKPLFWAPI